MDQSLDSKERSLLLELKRINDFLESRGTTFLSGKEMTLVDCDVMPKLQHIRVAGKVSHASIIKNFSKQNIFTIQHSPYALFMKIK